MNQEPPQHWLRIDAPLQARIVRDIVRYNLTRPPMIVLGAVIVLASLLVGVIASLLGVADRGVTALLTFVVVLVAFVLLAVLTMLFAVRRSIRAGLPVDSTVTASVHDDHLSVSGHTGSSQIRYDALRSVHAGRDAVICRMKGTPVVLVQPRAAFDDDAIRLLLSRVR